jgi:1-acyl-sn-glycerol-3-phosphate acyltransferase
MSKRPVAQRFPSAAMRTDEGAAGGNAPHSAGANGHHRGAANAFHRRTPLVGRLARLARIIMHLFNGLATTMFVFPWAGPKTRHALIRRWSRQFLRMLRVQLRVRWHHDGNLSGKVLIVSNHVSWLDIMVLNALHPARFVAKAELKRWPLAGRLFVDVGTLFIDRGRRSDTHSVNRSTVEALSRGDLVAVFPEGTTSDGRDLLKFHSSLLQPIVDAGGTVQPVAIRYRTPAGEHSDVPAYYGGMTFFRSFWQVTGERRFVAEVHLLTPIAASRVHRRALSVAAADAIRTVLASTESVRVPDRRGDRRV